MENNVSAVENSTAPVKTIELLDPRTRTVRKFTNTPDAVDKYIKNAQKAEKDMLRDSSFTAGAVGGAGLFAQFLYDGIKRHRFYPGKAIATGIFMGIVSFAATALIHYKTKICKLADDFMKDSEKRFMQKDTEGEKFTAYLNRKAEESDKIHEAKKEKPAKNEALKSEENASEADNSQKTQEETAPSPQNN